MNRTEKEEETLLYLRTSISNTHTVSTAKPTSQSVSQPGQAVVVKVETAAAVVLALTSSDMVKRTRCLSEK